MSNKRLFLFIPSLFFVAAVLFYTLFFSHSQNQLELSSLQAPIMGMINPPAEIFEENIQAVQNQTKKNHKAAHAPFKLSEDCKSFINLLDNQGTHYDWIKTNEINNDTKSDSVYVFYYYDFDLKKLSVQNSPGGSPFIMFNGGPGLDSHATYQEFQDLLMQVREKYKPKMVFLDQRGTGCSTPYPQKKSADDYSLWASTQIVKDAELVRQKLGFAKWNIWGQSFGSFIVQRYLQDYPQSIIRAIGHGASVLASRGGYYKERTEMQIEVIQKYFESFPEDKDLVKKIVNNNLCLDNTALCGADLVQELGKNYLAYQSAWEELHGVIHTAAFDGAPKKRQALAADNSSTSIDNLYFLNAVLNREIGQMYSDVDCFKVSRKALLLLGNSESFALSECWHFSQMQDYEYKVDPVKKWQLEPIRIEKIQASLDKNPQIEYYLFSAELDYYTPPAIISMAAGQIGSRVHYQKLMGVGHESYNSWPLLRLMNLELNSAF